MRTALGIFMKFTVRDHYGVIYKCLGFGGHSVKTPVVRPDFPKIYKLFVKARTTRVLIGRP